MSYNLTIEQGFVLIAVWSVCTTLFAFFYPTEFRFEVFYSWLIMTIVVSLKMLWLYWKRLMNEDPQQVHGS